MRVKARRGRGRRVSRGRLVPAHALWFALHEYVATGRQSAACTSAGECACAVRVRGVGCESASACVHVSDVSARVRVRVMPEVDMATQSEAHVAQMHASASDPARAREGKGGRGAHAQAGPECSAAAPRCITEACAPGRVSAAARACACTAGPHLPGSRRRVLPKALLLRAKHSARVSTGAALRRPRPGERGCRSP